VPRSKPKGAVRQGTSGAAKGAAAGAALGPEGAAAGAALGATKGAVKGHKQKAQYNADRAAANMRKPGRRALVAEFVVCMLIIGFAPLTDKHKTDGALAAMKRSTATCILFLILGLASSIGPRAARAAAGFGGLATLALLVSDRDIFAGMASALANPQNAAPGISSGAGAGAEAGGAVSGAIQQLLQDLRNAGIIPQSSTPPPTTPPSNSGGGAVLNA
jgi:hypothetical protein